MIDSPERYRKREQRERWRIAYMVAFAFIGVLLVAGSVASNIQQAQQSAETARVAQQTKAIVQGHNTELAHIEALATSIHRQQESDSQDRSQLNADVTKVAQYATSLASEVTANHASAIAGQQAICAQLNLVTKALGIMTSCSVPSPAA